MRISSSSGYEIGKVSMISKVPYFGGKSIAIRGKLDNGQRTMQLMKLHLIDTQDTLWIIPLSICFRKTKVMMFLTKRVIERELK